MVCAGNAVHGATLFVMCRSAERVPEADPLVDLVQEAIGILRRRRGSASGDLQRSRGWCHSAMGYHIHGPATREYGEARIHVSLPPSHECGGGPRDFGSTLAEVLVSTALALTLHPGGGRGNLWPGGTSLCSAAGPRRLNRVCS